MRNVSRRHALHILKSSKGSSYLESANDAKSIQGELRRESLGHSFFPNPLHDLVGLIHKLNPILLHQNITDDRCNYRQLERSLCHFLLMSSHYKFGHRRRL